MRVFVKYFLLAEM